MIKYYIQIIKPKIMFGNLISVVGGFFLAAKGQIDYLLLFLTVFGIALIISSGCVLNNYIDRDIDKKMKRTCNRITVNKLLSSKNILIYATILAFSGFTILYLTTNLYVISLSIFGFITYVFIYTLYLKRTSEYGIIVGSLSGSVPPAVGYCAVSNSIDICTITLMTIFGLWQIPHSYAIAILHLEDYKLTSIPILPVKKGISITKHHIMFYITGFTVASIIPTIIGCTGYKYLFVVTTANSFWLYIAYQGYKSTNNKAWARKIFMSSIIVIILLDIMMSLNFD